MSSTTRVSNVHVAGPATFEIWKKMSPRFSTNYLFKFWRWPGQRHRHEPARRGLAPQFPSENVPTPNLTRPHISKSLRGTQFDLFPCNRCFSRIGSRTQYCIVATHLAHDTLCCCWCWNSHFPKEYAPPTALPESRFSLVWLSCRITSMLALFEAIFFLNWRSMWMKRG